MKSQGSIYLSAYLYIYLAVHLSFQLSLLIIYPCPYPTLLKLSAENTQGKNDQPVEAKITLPKIRRNDLAKTTQCRNNPNSSGVLDLQDLEFTIVPFCMAPCHAQICQYHAIFTHTTPFFALKIKSDFDPACSYLKLLE